MKTLITGSTGFVGSHLVRELAGRGREVRALVHRRRPEAGEGKVEYLQGSICDYDAVEKAVDGVEIVYHCAAAIPQFVPDTGLMYQINVEGTNNILRSALRKGAKRIIFFSSAQVYGLREKAGFPCGEDAPLTPICDYGRQKVMCEKACMEYQKKGLEVIIFRPPLITGPGQNEPFFLGLMETIRKGGVVRMPGRRNRLFQTADVRDVVSACLIAEDNPEASGHAFNLGAEEVSTMEEWIKALIQYAKTDAEVRFVGKRSALVVFILKKLLLWKKPPVPLYSLRTMDRDFVLDISKAKKVLGWKPTKSVIESNIDSYLWVVENEALRQPECGSLA